MYNHIMLEVYCLKDLEENTKKENVFMRIWKFFTSSEVKIPMYPQQPYQES